MPLLAERAPAALYPPRVEPPDAPLPLWRFLPTFLRNPLRTLPRQVYEEPLFAPPQLGGRMAWITDPALVERVLLTEHEHLPKSPVEQRIFASVLGEGILTAEGQSWRWQRRTAAPLFRHQEIVGLLPDVARVAEAAADAWRALAPGTVRRIDHDMTNTTFDILSATIFSGATDDEQTALKHHVGAYLEHTGWDVALELLRVPAWVWHPSKPAMRRHARHLKATMSGILARERAAGFPGGGLMAKLGAARDPEAGEPMSDSLICQNLLTFAAAGHETTAKAMSWTLYLLARAPEWQDRLHAEIARVAGTGRIEAGHLDDLSLTRRVVKEGMRLYPPAPVLGRMTTRPFEIAGHRFEPGSMLIVPIWAIHRHRRLWDDPDRFDPDRFLPEREASMPRTQFMPFGFGPRICIGMGFAMMEAMILLATLVRAVRVEWDGRQLPEPVSRVTLHPKGGIALRIVPR